MLAWIVKPRFYRFFAEPRRQSHARILHPAFDVNRPVFTLYQPVIFEQLLGILFQAAFAIILTPCIPIIRFVTNCWRIVCHQAHFIHITGNGLQGQRLTQDFRVNIPSIRNTGFDVHHIRIFQRVSHIKTVWPFAWHRQCQHVHHATLLNQNLGNGVHRFLPWLQCRAQIMLGCRVNTRVFFCLGQLLALCVRIGP